ncbi:hypothetical protein ACFO3O_02440 [Dokdonia ponticola]|uniref:Outer membrane protein beta-barrel domain-containing protein n=1 Tax=Dokdonia ponticola TaxID=2041041 RepID=A0ABV9HSQ5_9FLAO
MNKIKVTFVLIVAIVFQIKAQEHQKHKEMHDDGRGFRIAGIIGHTLINTEGIDNVFVPSWGLDIEYWWNHKWGLGLHNDIEIETFIIRNSDNEEIERVNPFVITVDALYQFGGGFVVTLGPGVELEKEESFYLVRVGIEYEKDISNSLYLLPTLFLDQRFDGYNTWNIGLGVGLKL